MFARRLALGGFAWLCVLGCVVALGGAVADAAITHRYLSQITEVPQGSGAQFPGPFLGELGALTVDSGELYVVDSDQSSGQYRLDRFDATSRAFVSQIPPVAAVNALYQGVAVGHSTGETEIYETGDEGSGVVAAFSGANAFQGTWTGADTPAGSFGCFDCRSPASVAVDGSQSPGDWASGDVYVTDLANHVVDVFKPLVGGGEEYVTQLTGVSAGEPFSGVGQVAVSGVDGEVLVADQTNGGTVVDMFKPAAISGQYEYVGQLAGIPGGGFSAEVTVTGMAVDGLSGDIYVAVTNRLGIVGEENATGEVEQFTPAGVHVGRLTGGETPAGGFTHVSAVAVNPTTHDVYVGDRRVDGKLHNLGTAVDIFSPSLTIPDVTSEAPSGVTPQTATLHGTVNPLGLPVQECVFEYGETQAFGHTIPCAETPAQIGSGLSPVGVEATVEGLLPDTTYYYRLTARNENGRNPGEPSQDEEALTTGPGIHSESVTNVASSSATLAASIDPNDAPTSYYFQYGVTSAYENDVPVPPGLALGAGKGDVPVVQHLQGLLPGTVYHYRVVAVSELSAGAPPRAFDGPDRTFTTQVVPAGGSTLPDGRAWEMVSPANKLGAQILAIGQYSGEGAVIQAAADGGAITYMTASPTEAAPQGYDNYLQVISMRDPSGWVSRDIAAPHEVSTAPSIGEGEEYRFFSEDLSAGLLQPFGPFDPSLSTEASEQTPFLRTDFNGGDRATPCTSSCYRPLVTGAPGYANVPSGTAFSDQHDPLEECTRSVFCGPRFDGATGDLSHVVVFSNVALTSTPLPSGAGLYEWSGGALSLISVLPGEGAAALGGGGGFGSGRSGAGGLAADARGAISRDGSRVYWTAVTAGLIHLYLRDAAHGGKTLQLDAVQGGTGEGSPNTEFQLASSDGSRVFFTDTQKLTADSTGEADLYECEIVEESTGPRCALSDLTPKGGAAAGNASVVGASEDGSWLYFVTAPDGRLYVRHAGVTRPIATLSQADGNDWATQYLPHMTARVSPNGRWLAFMSQAELTGYDTRDAVSGQPDEEVYLYDAQADGGQGRLVCASCNPTGARPAGVEYAGIGDGLAGGDRVWPRTQWLAASLPGWTPFTGGLSLYQSRYLSDSGRLFFDSHDALVPQDVNGTEDVYEFEPEGIGGCSSSSVTFDVRSQGCVALISSGSSGEESGFMDASAGGGDAFFLTTARLSRADSDSAVDLYDARECTAQSPCLSSPPVSPPACDTGDSCKPAPSPQPAVFGAPASATFAGAGDVSPSAKAPQALKKRSTRARKLALALRACRKKGGRRRIACEHRARARYAQHRTIGKTTSGGRGR